MTAEDFPSYIKPDVWLDPTHALEYTTLQGETEPAGAHFIHRNKQHPDEWCIGHFQWRGSGPLWQVVSMDPLHFEPSIQCSCGEHGFIRDGKWIPA